MTLKFENDYFTVPNLFSRHRHRLNRQRSRKTFSSHSFIYDRVLRNLLDRLSGFNKQFNRGIVIGSRKSDVACRYLKLKNLQSVLLSDTVYNPYLSIMFDDELLPFKPCSFDLVINPLTLHYVNDLPGVLSQIKYSLEPDGLLMAALIGGESLYELKHVLLQAESESYNKTYQRVAPLVDPAMLGKLLQRAGYALPVIDLDRFTVTYDHILDLMYDLRGMGESSALHETSCLTRSLIERANTLYSNLFSKNGKLLATFEIIYLTGWSPHTNQQRALEPGSGTYLLRDVLK